MPTNSGHTIAIRAKKAIGTGVKDSQGENVGKVEDIVLDKTSNSIMFAVVSCGGVLGMGEKHLAVPWSALDYSERENAYVVGQTKDQLKQAPADTIDELTRDDGVGMRDRSYDYYRAQKYWE